MKDFELTPDDPKLTAYALGELDAGERAAVEAALRHDPAARAAVEEIRATAAQLESALAAESEIEVEAETESIAVPAPVDEYRRPKPGKVGQLLQFPQVYFVVGGFAAACFALMAILNPPPPPAPVVAKAPEHTYVPITIVSAPPEGNTTPLSPDPADRQTVAADAPARPARKIDAIENLADPRRDGGTTNAANVAVSTPPAIAPAPVEDAANRNATRLEIVDVQIRARETPAPTNAIPPTERPAGELVADTPVPTTPPDGAADSKVGEIQVAAPATGGTLVVGIPKAPAQKKVEPAPAPAESDIVALSAFSVATNREGVDAVRAGRVGRSGPPLPPAGAKLGGPGAGSGIAMDNDFLPAEENPRARIPIAAEAASYDDIRRVIEGGRLPAREMVRIEELVNHFPYRYPAPQGRDNKPFAASLEVAAAPWAPTHRLVRVALRGRDAPAVERLSAIARDVRIDVEFNPAKVSSYRLIGYENARLRKEDYAADKAGGVDVAAGHTLTALFEVVPVGAEERRVADRPAADDLRYQGSVVVSSRLEMPTQNAALANELLMVTVHYKNPGGIFAMTQQQEFPLTDAGRGFADASADFKFVAAVAQFGMILRGSPHRGVATMGDVVAWAAAGASSNADDPRGHRGDFIGLVRKTQVLLR